MKDLASKNVQSLVGLVGVLVLAGMQVIDGDAALGFLAGLLVRSPVSNDG